MDEIQIIDSAHPRVVGAPVVSVLVTSLVDAGFSTCYTSLPGASQNNPHTRVKFELSMFDFAASLQVPFDLLWGWFDITRYFLHEERPIRLRVPAILSVAQALDHKQGDLLLLSRSRLDLERLMDQVMLAHGQLACPKIMPLPHPNDQERQMQEAEALRVQQEWFLLFTQSFQDFFGPRSHWWRNKCEIASLASSFI